MVSLIICLPPPLRASVRPPILSAATAPSVRPSSDYWSAATASRFRPVLRSWFRSGQDATCAAVLFLMNAPNAFYPDVYAGGRPLLRAALLLGTA